MVESKEKPWYLDSFQTVPVKKPAQQRNQLSYQVKTADTKSSSSQMFGNPNRQPPQTGWGGYTPEEALEFFKNELTELEKIEVGVYDRIYTIGTVRRYN